MQRFATISNPSQRSAQVPLYQKKINTPLSHTNLQISLQHQPVTMLNNHIFHQAKLPSILKIFQWAQRCTRPEHIIPGKTGATEISCCIREGLLLSRQNAETRLKA